MVDFMSDVMEEIVLCMVTLVIKKSKKKKLDTLHKLTKCDMPDARLYELPEEIDVVWRVFEKRAYKKSPESKQGRLHKFI